MIALALLLATSSVEAPGRETLFSLDGPAAAAAGAGLAGGGALFVAFAGAGLTTISPAFVILPIIATLGLPLATGFGAVLGASLDAANGNAITVGVATGAGALAGAMIGGALALGVASLASLEEGSALVVTWCGGMIGGTITASGAAALTTSWAE